MLNALQNKSFIFIDTEKYPQTSQDHAAVALVMWLFMATYVVVQQ